MYIIVGSGCSGCHKRKLLHIFFCELRFENLVLGFGEQVGHLHNTLDISGKAPDGKSGARGPRGSANSLHQKPVEVEQVELPGPLS